MATTVLSFLARQRDQALSAASKLLKEGETGLRGMSIRLADDLESRLDDAARATERLDRVAIAVRHEPLTYVEGGRHSFFVDLVGEHTGAVEARERLKRHRQEMAVELERRDILRMQAWERAAEPLGMTREARDLTRVDGAGGHFAVPLWLLDQIGSLPRAGRVLADRVTSIPLPAGADSVSLPRLSAGAATAIQAADNAVVQETDPVDTAVTAPVRTIAGHVDTSVQIAEQTAPPGFDRLVFADLQADYNAKLEAQIINGSGASGQVAGLIGAAATTVTYTSATPTVAGTLSKVGDLAAQVSTARQLVPSVAVMAPRRGFWLTSQADAQSRTFNPVDLAAPERDPNVEPVGLVLGMALILDAAVPTNLGAGTEDRVIVTRPADHLLLESEPRLSIGADVGSTTLTVRFRFHRYVAFTAARVLTSTGVLAGTGLAAPVFA